MQQQGSKAKTPQKKGAHVFFGNPFFDNFSKTLILHHPLKTVHKKSPKNPIFIGSKKGQLIDPTMAKLLTLLWPKNGQVIDPTTYIYICVYICMYLYMYVYMYIYIDTQDGPGIEPELETGTVGTVFSRN